MIPIHTGLLNIAGAVSGAGNAIKEGASDIMKHQMLIDLEKTRQAYDDKRQEKMLEAQRGMHTETIAATAEQGRLQREQLATLTGQKIKSEEQIASGRNQTEREIAAGNRASAETIASGHDTTTKDIHENDRTSAERIAALNRNSAERIHDADRLLKKYEIDTTSESLTRTAASKAIGEVGSEITRLNTLLANPMLDPAGPQYKNLLTRLQRLEGLHDAYSRYLKPGGVTSESTPASASTPTQPAFNYGKYAPKAPSASVAPSNVAPTQPDGLLNSPGIRVVPMPSADVQNKMRQALPPNEEEMMRQSIEQ